MRLGAGAGLEPQFIESKKEAKATVDRVREILFEKGMPYFVIAMVCVAALAVAKKLDHQLVPLASPSFSRRAGRSTAGAIARWTRELATTFDSCSS